MRDNANEAHQRLIQARTAMILDMPFFGSLALRLELKADPACKTLWTDAISMGFNPSYVMDVAYAELVAVLCHEVLHVALGHTWRRGNRENRKWNKACDYAVNPMVRDAGMTVGKGWLLDDRYVAMSAEQIFNLLPPEDGGGDGEGESGDQPDGSASGQGSPGGGNPSGEAPSQDDGPSDFGPGEVRDYPVADKQAEAQAEWDVSIAQAASTAIRMGKLPGDMARFIKDLLRPKVDWRSLLQRFAQQSAMSDYSWRRPNPRYVVHGFYLPSIRSEEMGPMVIGVDTSGSIDQALIDAFAAEINAIAQAMKPEKVTVIYADARVQKVDVFGRDEPILINPKGGGGTSFRPVFDYVADQGGVPACLVYLTDMEGAFPDEAPGYPVLWASTSRHVITAPFGEVVPVEL